MDFLSRTINDSTLDPILVSHFSDWMQLQMAREHRKP